MSHFDLSRVDDACSPVAREEVPLTGISRKVWTLRKKTIGLILQILILKPFDLLNCTNFWKSGFVLTYLDKADSSISRTIRFHLFPYELLSISCSILNRDYGMDWHGKYLFMIFFPYRIISSHFDFCCQGWSPFNRHFKKSLNSLKNA